jgi:hypothetical protein
MKLLAHLQLVLLLAYTWPQAARVGPPRQSILPACGLLADSIYQGLLLLGLAPLALVVLLILQVALAAIPVVIAHATVMLIPAWLTPWL